MAIDYAHDSRVQAKTYLDAGEAERLRVAAEGRGISVAEAIREALALWYAEEERRAPEREREEALRRWVVEGGPRPT